MKLSANALVGMDAAPKAGRRQALQAGVQSVENGLQLILILAHSRRPMKITEIAAQAGIAASKAHRYLVSFTRGGFVTQDEESGLYTMGPAALEFSLSCLSTIEPISLASREALRLCRDTGHTVAVSVWGSFGPTIVRWEQPARPTMVNIGLGSVFPLYRSATGRVFAAFMAPQLIRAYLDSNANVDQETASIESLAKIRTRSLARAEGDFMAGMSAFAAPVFDDRARLVMVLTVLGYETGFDHRWSSPIAQALSQTTTRVSHMLGYRPMQPEQTEAAARHGGAGL